MYSYSENVYMSNPRTSVREPYIIELTHSQMFRGYLLPVGCKMVKLASFLIGLGYASNGINACNRCREGV